MRKHVLGITLLLTMILLSGCGTAIPDVSGFAVADAKAAITTAGFTVSVIYDEASTAATWTVTAQVPKPGERAKKGSAVKLTVAGGPPVAAPDLAGLDREQAASAIEGAGLVLGQVTESYDASVVAGLAVSQTPSAGIEVPKGSAVDFVLSMGPKPVAVPDVVGKTEADARRKLVSTGFSVKVLKMEDSAKKGTVIAQKPSGGEAQPGTAVKITVSKGIVMVRVPDLDAAVRAWVSSSGEWADESDIQRVVANACDPLGLRWRVTYEHGIPPGQSPTAGTRVKKGTVVRANFPLGD